MGKDDSGGISLNDSQEGLLSFGSPIVTPEDKKKRIKSYRRATKEKERQDEEKLRRKKLKDKFERRLETQKKHKREVIAGIGFLPEQYMNPEIAFNWIRFLAVGGQAQGWEMIGVRFTPP